MKKLLFILCTGLFCACGGDIDIPSKKSPGDVISDNTTTEVLIGNQKWMTVNLNVEYFRNGDPIPHCKTNEERDNAGEKKQPCWSYYDDKSSNGEKYGKLYNWYAVMDSRGLSPVGWHIPSDVEIKTLVRCLEEEVGTVRKNASEAMKSTSGWADNDDERGDIGGNGNNRSGFNALPGGVYISTDAYNAGRFEGIGSMGSWWGKNKDGRDEFGYGLSSGRNHLGKSWSNDKSYMVSVRCLKD